jgi:hypothetical protein
LFIRKLALAQENTHVGGDEVAAQQQDGAPGPLRRTSQTRVLDFISFLCVLKHMNKFDARTSSPAARIDILPVTRVRKGGRVCDPVIAKFL